MRPTRNADVFRITVAYGSRLEGHSSFKSDRHLSHSIGLASAIIPRLLQLNACSLTVMSIVLALPTIFSNRSGVFTTSPRRETRLSLNVPASPGKAYSLPRRGPVPLRLRHRQRPYAFLEASRLYPPSVWRSLRPMIAAFFDLLRPHLIPP